MPGRDAVEEKTIAELQADLTAGRTTSVALVDAYLQRIDRLDDAGPTLNAVLAKNPRARDDAASLDAERKAKGPRGPLHGIPILVKDNIETADPMPTTAGSLALAENVTMRDAPIVARLRAAGAIILGKTNLSEWANMRSNESISGWSAIGGLTKNPYALDRNACGSSSGSGAAVAASLGAAALGTDTSGSIICPSAVSGVVGLSPTVGLLSRTHLVPVSRTQDAPGPIGRTVADAAALLTVMAGSDPLDPATAEADAHKQDYSAALRLDALRGKRVGLLAFLLDNDPDLDLEMEDAIDVLRDAGAEVVRIDQGPDIAPLQERQAIILLTEMRVDLNRYLETAAPAVRCRSLADLIAFNEKNAPAELALFGQDLLRQAEATRGLDDPRYKAALVYAEAAAGPGGIDRLLAEHEVDVLVGPTAGRAWENKTLLGAGSFNLYATLSSVAGYPQLTVPMGDIMGLPVGLSFIGPAWSDGALLGYGYAYEQRAHARIRPTYAPTVSERGRTRARIVRRLAGWPGALGGAGILAVGLGAVLVRRRARRPVKRASSSARVDAPHG
ncbi:MAG: amidase [Byssovorax sp.]